MVRLTLLLVAAPCAAACFPHQTASSGTVSCSPDEIEIRDQRIKPGLQGPIRTWTAICGERQHQCTSGSEPGTAVCHEVFARDPNDRLDDYRVMRGFDARRQAQTIAAHLRIDVRRSLDLVAAPAADPTVHAIVRLLAPRDLRCETARFIANSVPVPSTPGAARQEGSTHRLDAELGEELLRELRRPHPTLTIEGCGQTLALDERAMVTLSEFTRMYDDLADLGAGESGRAPGADDSSD